MSSNNTQGARLSAVEQSLAQQGNLLAQIAAAMGIAPQAPTPQYAPQAPAPAAAPQQPKAERPVLPQLQGVADAVNAVIAGNTRWAFAYDWAEQSESDGQVHHNMYLAVKHGKTTLTEQERNALLQVVKLYHQGRKQFDACGRKVKGAEVTWYWLGRVGDVDPNWLGQALTSVLNPQPVAQPQTWSGFIVAPQQPVYAAAQTMMAPMAAIPPVPQKAQQKAAPAPKAAAPAPQWVRVV